MKELKKMMSESTDRPAWTSTVETGNLEAYKHKSAIVRGRFAVLRDYYNKMKGKNR